MSRYTRDDFFGPDATSLIPRPSIPSTQEMVDNYQRSNPAEIATLKNHMYDTMMWYFKQVGIINEDGTINRDNARKMWNQFKGESYERISSLVYKKLRAVCRFASLYYLPCKEEIPGLTIDEFAFAFLLYYMSAKGNDWQIYFEPGKLGMNVQRIQRCQIFLTNFDTLSPLVEPDGREVPDNPMELTRTLQRNYGGKRRKSRKIRKSKSCKRKGIKQKSRTSTSR